MANRRKQIEAIQAKARTLYDEVSELLDDLRESYDNIPDSLKDSDKGVVASDRIDHLEYWLDELDTIGNEVIE